MNNTPILFRPEFDHPQLTDIELAKHPDTAFEWWYFDFSTADGFEGVIVYGYRNPLFATGKVSVFLQLKSPKANVLRVRNFPATEFDANFDGGSMRLEFASGQVLAMTGEGSNLVWTLDFNIEGVLGHLVVTPRNCGFRPSETGQYMVDPVDNRHSSVCFSAPTTQVQGVLICEGVHTDITGIGYHDHPWGTAQLMITNRHWQWVRARQAETAVMFAKVQPQPDFQGGLDFLYLGKPDEFIPEIAHSIKITSSDWSKAHFYGIRFPHNVKVASTLGNWSATATGFLLDTPVYNRSNIVWLREKDSLPSGEGWVEFYNINP